MNKDTIQGNFTQLKGKIKQQWGKLTDDEIDQMEGHAEILAGKLQERYGLERDEAEREPPCAEYPWDGVRNVRPFSKLHANVVEGVY